MSSKINKALETFYKGDKLNNADLVLLHDHAVATAELLSHMGQRFRLACREALYISNTCEGFIRAREECTRYRKAEG